MSERQQLQIDKQVLPKEKQLLAEEKKKLEEARKALEVERKQLQDKQARDALHPPAQTVAVQAPVKEEDPSLPPMSESGFAQLVKQLDRENRLDGI